MDHQRRTLLKAGVGAVFAPLASACKGAATTHSNTAPSEWEMPLESEPHERTFMQWPVSRAVYDRASLERVQKCIALIANTISKYEPVVMLAAKAHAPVARRLLAGNVEIWDVPTDDLWCRDSGPTFVRNQSGELAVAHLRFNGWGRKQPHSNDALVAPRIAKRLGLPLLPTGLVGEQGGVEHDGAGTLMAHASCWANPNRNRISQAMIGERLMRSLGGDAMIWAPGVKGKDITDFHIDALARFIGPGKVLIQLDETPDPDDPWSVAGHETLRILRNSRSATGARLAITRLPEPVDIRSDQPDFVASYVNYYVCNGAVIAAQFGDDEADARARTLLSSIYPGRSIEMLNIDALGESGGGIHCATQQQPLVVHA